jgi:long-chain acyl-CoA synthetase
MSDSVYAQRPWLQHYGDIPATLTYPDTSLWEVVAKAVEKHSDKIALDYFGTTVTFKGLLEKIEQCAKAFKVQGIKQNDTVSVCMPNSIEGIVSIYAINMIGARADVFHPLTSQNEIKTYIKNSDSKAIVTIDNGLQKVVNIVNEDNELSGIKIICVYANDSMKSPVLKMGYELLYAKKTRKVKHKNIVSYKKEFLQSASTANIKSREKEVTKPLSFIVAVVREIQKLLY